LAKAGGNAIGCTQLTEILNTPGVEPAGTLPPGLDLATTYTAAVCARAERPDQAQRLAALLAGESSRGLRQKLGFEA
jgi:molybdate transport system substrate-binding protein